MLDTRSTYMRMLLDTTRALLYVSPSSMSPRLHVTPVQSEACIRALAAEQGLAVRPWEPSASSGGKAAKKHVVLTEA